MSPKKESLLLVDGHALIHRGFHALPNLTNREGVPTGAVFGFTRLLLAAIKVIKPDYVAVTFDSKGKTFRHKMYDKYKAHRAEAPSELYVQIPLVKEIVEDLNMPIFAVPGFEADDLIGTLAKQATKKKLRTTILTGDLDMLQLVDENTAVFAPQKGISDPMIYTPAGVKHRYSFGPEKIVFYKALRGDPSDNIPGVPSVGEVTAKKLVGQFAGLDELYQYLKTGKKIPEISPSIQAKLRDNKDKAYLSYKLATILTDVPVTLKKEACVVHEYDHDKVVDVFVRLGFRTLLQELPKNAAFIPTNKTAGIEALFAADQLESQLPSTESALDQSLKPLLRKMERKGVKVDVPYLQQLNQEWEGELVAIAQKIHHAAGSEFNIASSQQLADVLFNKLKLPTAGIKRLESGFSTDAAQLELLLNKHPIVKEVLEYREIAKLINTYTKPLVALVDKDDRLHTTYEANTATGRLSSKNPNLQNIPIRSERGSKLRRVFIADTGKVLLSADYSQIELRVVAHLAKDPVMIAAFRAGKDIHAATSKEMDVDRRVAKVINFSILYGKGPHGFARDLEIDFADAKKYIDRYFATYRGINKWIEETLRFVGQHGYVETLFHHRRDFPDLKNTHPHRYGRRGREAINLPVQGTAAEILKRAMVALGKDPELAEALILTVHDELVFELTSKAAHRLLPKIRTIMERTTTLDVPITVEAHSGKNWAEAKT